MARHSRSTSAVRWRTGSDLSAAGNGATPFHVETWPEADVTAYGWPVKPEYMAVALKEMLEEAMRFGCRQYPYDVLVDLVDEGVVVEAHHRGRKLCHLLQVVSGLEKLQAAAETPATETGKTPKAAKPEESTIEKVMSSSVTKSIMRTAGNTIVRSVLGSLGLGGRTTRKKSTNWF